jgi:hypothetical protein
MDEPSNRAAPQHVIEALDASVRDIAAGRVYDARGARAEARRILADHDGARSAEPSLRRETTGRRTRSTT